MAARKPAAPPLPSDLSARDLKTHGLRYSSDSEPGITRRRSGKGFNYRDAEGNTIRDRAELARVKGLAVPPAYTDVWICRDESGHLQATGRDARGRKQYRYHPRWREVRDAAKYHRLLAFAETLPGLRRRVSRDLGRDGLPPEKVVAAVVRLLERSLIRVGNPEYLRDNDSHGLTTLHDDNVDVEPDAGLIHFEFVGKGGKEWSLDVRDPRVAEVVQACEELPGQHLFQYVGDDGGRHVVRSDDVNTYLHTHGGEDFTAKDFRTWAGTVLAFDLLSGPPPETKKETAQRRKQAMVEVSRALRNTHTIAQRCYVHPAVLDAFEERRLPDARAAAEACSHQAPEGLRASERVVWTFLRDAASGQGLR